MAIRRNISKEAWERRIREITGGQGFSMMPDSRLGAAPSRRQADDPEYYIPETQQPQPQPQQSFAMPQGPDGAVLDRDIIKPKSTGRGASFSVQPALISYKGQFVTMDQYRALRDEDMRQRGEERTSYGSRSVTPEVPRDRRLARSSPVGPEAPPMPEPSAYSRSEAAYVQRRTDDENQRAFLRNQQPSGPRYQSGPTNLLQQQLAQKFGMQSADNSGLPQAPAPSNQRFTQQQMEADPNTLYTPDGRVVPPHLAGLARALSMGSSRGGGLERDLVSGKLAQQYGLTREEVQFLMSISQR